MVIVIVVTAMIAVARKYAAAQQDACRYGEDKEKDAFLHKTTERCKEPMFLHR
jgi:hypothetical protein